MLLQCADNGNYQFINILLSLFDIVVYALRKGSEFTSYRTDICKSLDRLDVVIAPQLKLDIADLIRC